MYHQRLFPNLFRSGILLLLAFNALAGPSLSRVSAAAPASKDRLTGVQAVESASPDAVIAWNKIALRTSVTVAQQNQPQAQMYLAQIQAAVYNAVMAIEGRYELYKSDLELQPGASVDAAVATAAYTMLVHHFPAQQAALDADYATALAAIPDGEAKTAGVEVGQNAAAEIIALRQGDGLEADIGFQMPPPAPGVWQLPSGVAPLSPWISRLRPYLIESPDQFRPGPPPSLDSIEWATEYEEVQRMGRNNSPYRTAEQTDAARFWTTHAPVQYNTAFQQVALKHGLDAAETARLLAMGNMIGADALIGCFDAKYYYLFWRPSFAIPQGDTDGNPDTVGDPSWLPLLGTPPHPEYPSAHSCLTSSIAEMFAAFLGTQRIEVDLTSTAPNLIHPTRHYRTANDLLREIIDARVWGGIHYRESDVKGATLGRKVAHWALKRYFLPTEESLGVNETAQNSLTLFIPLISK